MNVLIAALLGLVLGWMCVQAVKIAFGEMTGKNKSRTKDWQKIARAMRNQDHLIFHRNGAIEVDVNKMMRHPKVKTELKNTAKLYKAMVLKALWNGEKPPHQYGDILPMNKERLLIEWNDEWQEQLERIGLTYNQFFDIKEEPEFTAEEIAAQYVEEKDKKEGIGESTLRRYAGSNRSLRL